MKKALIAIAVLVLSAWAGTRITAEGPSITAAVVPSNRTPYLGQVFTAAVVVNAPHHSLGSYTATLRWNPAELSYVGNSGPPAGFMGVVNATTAANGSIRFNGVNIYGATGSTTVLTVTLVTTRRGSSTLGLDFSALAEARTFANLLPLLRVADGHVRVWR